MRIASPLPKLGKPVYHPNGFRRELMSATDVSEGQVVQGYITFVGGVASWTGPQFISFSYSVKGQRFHKSLGETVDAWSTATIRKASYGLKVEIQCLYGALSPIRKCVVSAKSQSRNQQLCV